MFMVYARDDVANKDLFVSYGLCPLPNSPGLHHVTCRTWYAVESNQVNGRNLFGELRLMTGSAPHMQTCSMVSMV